MASSKPFVKVEVVCDVSCPYCWIGKRRLQKCMKKLEDRVKFELQLQPYQLRPEAPYTGMPVPPEYKDSKVRQNLLKMGDELDIHFTFCYKCWPNTALSHTLLHFVGAKDGGVKQGEVAETIFKTHFIDGVLLSEDVMVSIGQQYGYDPKEVRDYITDQNFINTINKLCEDNKKRISGMIPVYFFNGVESVVGAQSEEEFLNKLTLAAENAAAKEGNEKA